MGFGGLGDDTLNATNSGGDNRIYGGAGDDDFFNGNGDRLIGGDGDDRFFMADSTITGGLGENQFWIASSEVPGELNTVTDFEVGIDIIGIGVIGATFQNLTFTDDGADTIISFGGNDLAKFLRVGVEILNNSDNFLFS